MKGGITMFKYFAGRASRMDILDLALTKFGVMVGVFALVAASAPFTEFIRGFNPIVLALVSVAIIARPLVRFYRR